MHSWKRCLSAFAVVLAVATAASAQNTLKSPATGNPAIKSIDVIGFAPDGVLLIGDGKGKQLVAIATGDTKGENWKKTEIASIKDRLAERIGTTGKGIEIIKMAVNPASHTAYFAVRALESKNFLILTVNADGKVNEFRLDNVKYVAIPLPLPDGKVTKITDVTWAKDRVLVAAQAGETFSSKIVSVPAPLAADGSCVCISTETYHVAHGKWETNAPIRTVIPYEEEGKRFLVGAFTCTPIVKYPIEDLKPDIRVKGISVIELGNGNTPQDMFTYEKNGKTYILMNHFRMKFAQDKNPVGPSPYWTAKVDHTILREMDKINENALRRIKNKASESVTERAIVAKDYHGVVMMDRLDNERALVIRTDDKGGFDLRVLMLP